MQAFWRKLGAAFHRIKQRLVPEKKLGERGEDVAARFLQRKGYTIVARGERDVLGELDVVAVDNRTIVFVEVKTRQSHVRGHPLDAITDEKQRRLTRLALGYMRRNDLLGSCSARFDVVAVTWPSGSRKPSEITHIANAFDAVGNLQMFS